MLVAVTRKRIKKSKAGPAKEALPARKTPAAASAETAASPAPGIVRGVYEEEVWPSPEQLYREAEAEPNYRNLSSYSDVIGTLREKGFSYRDIAEWLSERGISVDHNAVYRIFMNSLPANLAHREMERVSQEEADEARLNEI
jgi:hypothetical protein